MPGGAVARAVRARVSLSHRWLRPLVWIGRSGSRGGRRPSRKVRTSKGEVVERSTRGNPRESATETNRLRPPSHVNGGPARVKWVGKSAPTPRRRGGWANPTRWQAQQDP